VKMSQLTTLDQWCSLSLCVTWWWFCKWVSHRSTL